MLELEPHPTPRSPGRAALRRAVLVGLCALGALGGCSGDDDTSDAETRSGGSTTMTSDAASSSEDPPPLEDGRLEAGRYRFTLETEGAADLLDCPEGESSAPPLGIDLTVRSDDWEADLEFVLIAPSPESTDAPDGGALVMGWTTQWVGLNSDPCIPIGTPNGHLRPDTPIGPTVDDFVEAVLANPALDITEPTDVSLGEHHGRFFTLTAPSDLSGCDNWRPWDPGFFAQGPGNIWDVWVMDVDGFRVLIVTDYFPDTSDEVKSGLREMAESIRFAPPSLQR